MICFRTKKDFRFLRAIFSRFRSGAIKRNYIDLVLICLRSVFYPCFDIIPRRALFLLCFVSMGSLLWVWLIRRRLPNRLPAPCLPVAGSFWSTFSALIARKERGFGSPASGLLSAGTENLNHPPVSFAMSERPFYLDRFTIAFILVNSALLSIKKNAFSHIPKVLNPCGGVFIVLQLNLTQVYFPSGRNRVVFADCDGKNLMRTKKMIEVYQVIFC